MHSQLAFFASCAGNWVPIPLPDKVRRVCDEVDHRPAGDYLEACEAALFHSRCRPSIQDLFAPGSGAASSWPPPPPLPLPSPTFPGNSALGPADYVKASIRNQSRATEPGAPSRRRRPPLGNPISLLTELVTSCGWKVVLPPPPAVATSPVPAVHTDSIP